VPDDNDQFGSDDGDGAVAAARRWREWDRLLGSWTKAVAKVRHAEEQVAARRRDAEGVVVSMLAADMPDIEVSRVTGLDRRQVQAILDATAAGRGGRAATARSRPAPVRAETPTGPGDTVQAPAVS
jgi:hypothetical protein